MCFHQTNRFVSFYSIESDLCELTQRAVTSRELFFYSASLLVFFMAAFLFVSLWFWHLLVEWVIRPSGASEGHDTGLNRSQHWRYFKATYTPPGWQQPPGSHVSSSSGHTVTLTTGFHLSRSLRSLLADGGDKAAARSRFERPAQMVYLCSAVPPHCCA